MSNSYKNIYFGVSLSGSVKDDEEEFPLYYEIQLIIKLIEQRGMVNLLPQLKGNRNLIRLRKWMDENVLSNKTTNQKVSIAEYCYERLLMADAAIFEATYPSWGPAQEFGFLQAQDIPILFIQRHDSINKSFMPYILHSKKFTKSRPNTIITYGNKGVLEKLIVEFLNKI